MLGTVDKFTTPSSRQSVLSAFAFTTQKKTDLISTKPPKFIKKNIELFQNQEIKLGKLAEQYRIQGEKLNDITSLLFTTPPAKTACMDATGTGTNISKTVKRKRTTYKKKQILEVLALYESMANKTNAMQVLHSNGYKNLNTGMREIEERRP